MLFLEKRFVQELMLDKYPQLKFEPPVPCSFNLNTSQFGNNITTLIQSIIGTAGNTGLVGEFMFSFMKEATPDRAYDLNVGITDFRDASFPLLGQEMEAMTEEVSKQITLKRETLKFHYPFLELTDISANWDAAVFTYVSVNFVGWKLTKGNC
jgi:hypothetical protein